MLPLFYSYSQSSYKSSNFIVENLLACVGPYYQLMVRREGLEPPNPERSGFTARRFYHSPICAFMAGVNRIELLTSDLESDIFPLN